MADDCETENAKIECEMDEMSQMVELLGSVLPKGLEGPRPQANRQVWRSVAPE